MRLGVFTVLFSDRPFEDVLQYISSLGVNTVEIGCANYPGDAHLSPEILKDKDKIKKFKELLIKYNIKISGLSCHGNPLHPDKNIARVHLRGQHNAILLAQKLGVDRIVTFSGCPGDSENSRYPNWVTCAWPEDYQKILAWQWEKIISFWKKEANFAKGHGIEKIAIEMHPGFCVYNPMTLLKLRKSVGPVIGANLDPSHLFWQGIDPVEAVKKLKGAIYHIHAKDTEIYKGNVSINGVLDITSYSDVLNRSWIFRTVGYGHGKEFWRKFISTLRLVGYDHAISIEHEDILMSKEEGFQKAVEFLKPIIFTQKRPEMWWA
jgi:sugar phosphate isomerase/epimerase